ncbi:MAG: hypothetical protein GXP56_11970, partial [Deltaproteobacteria bacterium]|nr:hypothetical protein [Deltaproteobacteria bacterium]
MIESNYKSGKLFNLGQALAISILLSFFLPHIAAANQAVMNEIQILNDPLSVKFFMTRIIPVKVIQVEKKEILVALKNVKLKKGFKITGKEKSVISHIAIENLQGNVVAVILTSSRPYGYVRSGFNKSDSSFILNLEKKYKKQEPLKAAFSPQVE